MKGHSWQGRTLLLLHRFQTNLETTQILVQYVPEGLSTKLQRLRRKGHYRVTLKRRTIMHRHFTQLLIRLHGATLR